VRDERGPRDRSYLTRRRGSALRQTDPDALPPAATFGSTSARRASDPPFRATIVIFSRHRLKPFVTRWRHVAIRISCRVYALVKYDPLIQEGLVGVVRKWLERRSGSKGRRCDFRQLVT